MAQGTQLECWGLLGVTGKKELETSFRGQSSDGAWG